MGLMAQWQIQMELPSYKVHDKETNEQMHSKNTGTGQDLSLECLDKRPVG